MNFWRFLVGLLAGVFFSASTSLWAGEVLWSGILTAPSHAAGDEPIPEIGVRDLMNQDAARYELVRTQDDGLLLTVKVADEQISTPHPVQTGFQNDSVEVFLDLRMPDAGDTGLGKMPKSAGVTQVILQPDGQWHQVGGPGEKPAGAHLESERRQGGYQLRWRLPADTLEAIAGSADRLDHPLGIAIQVNDIDELPEGGYTARRSYSSNRESLNWLDPRLYTRLVPGSEVPGDGLGEPVFQVTTGGKIIVWKFPEPAAEGAPARLETPLVKWHLEAGPFEGQPGGTESEGTLPLMMGPSRSWTFPRVKIVKFSANLPRLPAGRLQMELAESGTSTRMYSWPSRKRNPRVFLLGSEPPAIQEVREEVQKSRWTVRPREYYVSPKEDVSLMTAYDRSAERLWTLSATTDAGEPLEWGISRQAVVATAEDLVLRQAARLPEEGRMQFTPLPAKELRGEETIFFVQLIWPDGAVQPVKLTLREGDLPETEYPVSFTIKVRAADDLPRPLESGVTPEVRDSNSPRAYRIASPYREQYPTSSTAHTYARGVGDLAVFDGHLFVGAGDWQRNQGPVDLFALSLDSVTFGEHAGKPEAIGAAHGQWKRELKQPAEEAFDRLAVVEWNGSRYLVAPGTDPREGWDFGNLYVRDAAGEWVKRRTIPGGIHAFDAAVFQEQLYVTTGSLDGTVLYRSADLGEKWAAVPWTEEPGENLPMPGRAYGMVPLPGPDAASASLLVFPDDMKAGLWQVDAGGKLRVLEVPGFMGLADMFVTAQRAAPAARGAVIIPMLFPLHGDPREITPQDDPQPLYYLEPGGPGGRILTWSRNRWVSDVLRHKRTLYALCVTEVTQDDEGGEWQFQTEILETDAEKVEDLKHWNTRATLSLPAFPESLEISGDFDRAAGEGLLFWIGTGGFYRAAVPASGDIFVIRSPTVRQ